MTAIAVPAGAIFDLVPPIDMGQFLQYEITGKAEMRTLLDKMTIAEIRALTQKMSGEEPRRGIRKDKLIKDFTTAYFASRAKWDEQRDMCSAVLETLRRHGVQIPDGVSKGSIARSGEMAIDPDEMAPALARELINLGCEVPVSNNTLDDPEAQVELLPFALTKFRQNFGATLLTSVWSCQKCQTMNHNSNPPADFQWHGLQTRRGCPSLLLQPWRLADEEGHQHG